MKRIIIFLLAMFPFIGIAQSNMIALSDTIAAKKMLKGNTTARILAYQPVTGQLFLVGLNRSIELPLASTMAPKTRTITVSAGLGVSVSGGTQDLSSNRTWTVSLPQIIDTTASPIFSSLKLNTGAADGKILKSSSTGVASWVTVSSALGGAYLSTNNPNATGNAVLPATTTIGNVSSTEITYLDSLTSQVQVSVYNIAELRTKIGRYNQIASVSGYYQENDEGGGKFIWKSASTATDNGGTIIQVTGVATGRWIRIVEDKYFVEWFGAKGDGATNDSTSFANAREYVGSLPKGGTIELLARTYVMPKLYLKKWVNWVGTEKYLAGGAVPTLTGTTIKRTSTTNFTESFIELIPDNTFTQQTGEKDGLSKSYPNFSLTNISFDAGNSTNYTVDISQSWGFSIDKCKFSNGKAYSLNITDCNEYSVTNCSISRFLSLSNADYIHYGNDIVGSTKFPAYYGDRTGAGTMGNNKIYFGGDETSFYEFTPVSISSGVIKVNKYNHLTSNPNYQISGTGGSVSFVESTQVLTATSTNGAILVAFANLAGILEVGQTYKLTGQVQLSGVSANRNVVFACGNNSQTYGSITANAGLQNISITFVFNPTSNIFTSPLRIQIDGVTVTGVDNIVFSNLKVTSSFSRLNGVPVVFNYPSTVSTALKNAYLQSESFYPKWLSDTTMVLFSSLYNYYNSPSGYISMTESSISNAKIEIPNCVMFLGGRMSMSGTYVNNKIEDIYTNGVILRGAYNNVFSGNKISKGIATLKNSLSSLMKFEKGAERNTISANSISARTEDLNDMIGICVNFDEYSGGNILTSNTIKNANYIDIYDDYLGEKNTQNVYDKNTLLESFVYKRKPTDYQYKNKGILFEKGKTSNATNSTTLLANTEFSLHFENVKLSNMTSDANLFQQKDIAIGSQDGRFLVRVSSAGALYTIINATPVITTASGAIVANKYYNITVTKDLLNVWKLYIDGVLIVSNTGSATAIATGGSTKSYIGAGDASQGADVFMSGFKSFNEPLSEVEIKNLNYQGSTNNLASSSLLTSKAAGTSFFSTITAGSVTLDTGTGIDGGNSLKVASLANNAYYIGISSANMKSKVLRISGYVKSPTLTGVNILRNFKAKNVLVDTSYTRFVKYISPEYNNIGDDSFFLKFGSLSDVTFGKSFSALAGNTYLDYVKISTNYYPCNADLDFSVDAANRSYQNGLSNTDLFALSDTYGRYIVKEAASATLVSGTVTVSNINVGANSIIILTPQETGTLTGILKVSARTAGTSFTVTSSVGTDTVKFGYLIIN